MDVSNVISAIAKKILPDLAGAAISMVGAYWALQAVSAVPVLMWVIRIAVTIFIVLYLAITILDAYLNVIDRHRLRQGEIARLEARINQGRIVDADPSPRSIGSFSQFGSLPSFPTGSFNRSLKKVFFIICVIVLIVTAVLSGIFYYFHLHGGTGSIFPDNGLPSSVIAANPYPGYFHGHGSLAVYDPLTQSSGSLWQTTSRCKFMRQAYHVTTSRSENMNVCFGPQKQFKNFTYEVEMTILKGDCGGLLFRMQSSNKYYFFQVCQDRGYALLKNVDNNPADAHVFHGVSQNNSAITPGFGKKNRIAVIARGGSLYLYIHDHQVAEIDDSSYVEGYIGLIAYSPTKATITEVAYQNVRLWEDTTG